MTELAHRRILRLLTLALVAVWMITVTTAGAAVVPAMHCPAANMPCCPLSHGNAAQCVASECIGQVPQKAEARLEAQVHLERMPTAIMDAVQPSPSPAFVSEMYSGLRFQAAVFRLKDDLRI